MQILIQFEIKEIAEVSIKDLITRINKEAPEDIRVIIDGISKMNTIERQKSSFAAAKNQLLSADLTEHEIFTLLAECYMMKTRLKKKLKKLK